jgi:hypothetical protein
VFETLKDRFANRRRASQWGSINQRKAIENFINYFSVIFHKEKQGKQSATGARSSQNYALKNLRESPLTQLLLVRAFSHKFLNSDTAK